MHLSDKLLNELEKDTGIKFTLCSRRKMQKSIRDYFIQIHNEAVQSTVIATNRSLNNNSKYIEPQFYDK